MNMIFVCFLFNDSYSEPAGYFQCHFFQRIRDIPRQNFFAVFYAKNKMELK